MGYFKNLSIAQEERDNSSDDGEERMITDPPAEDGELGDYLYEQEKDRRLGL